MVTRWWNHNFCKCSLVFGFRTYGQRSSGFGVAYDKLEDALKYEPTRRLAKNGLHGVENKILKDSKLRCKKIRGVKNRKKQMQFQSNDHDMFFGCLFDIRILESMVLYIYETHLCLFCYIVTCKYDQGFILMLMVISILFSKCLKFKVSQ